MSARMKCLAHCGGCGRHFAGDRAFDAHRRGKGAERRCHDPQDVGLEIKRTDGRCDMYGPEQYGQVIWQTPAVDNPFAGHAEGGQV